MQNLVNLLPLAAFLIAYLMRGIYAATAVLMIAMVLVVIIDYARLRRVTPVHLFSTVLVLIFGTATLLLRDPRFLKWKPTIFMWLLAAAHLGSEWIGSMPLAQRLFQAALTDQAPVARADWLKLNRSWVVFYLMLGAINLWVAFHASEKLWVYFKAIGLTVMLMVFAVLQMLWLSSRPSRQQSP